MAKSPNRQIPSLRLRRRLRRSRWRRRQSRGCDRGGRGGKQALRLLGCTRAWMLIHQLLERGMALFDAAGLQQRPRFADLLTQIIRPDEVPHALGLVGVRVGANIRQAKLQALGSDSRQDKNARMVRADEVLLRSPRSIERWIEWHP